MIRIPASICKQSLSSLRNIGRHILKRNLAGTSVILTSKSDEEDELESNPYYKKYADKIKIAKESGVYKAKKVVHDQLRKETEQWKRNIEFAEKKLLAEEKKKSASTGTKLPKELKELVHLDLFESKLSNEISEIWSEYFKDKDCISAVISTETYKKMKCLSDECPMFLYPLPKSQGYEFMLSHFDDNRCFFTSLINYQVHEMNAPWQLCLTYYNDFEESKGIVLMASELDLDSLNVLEAQCLAQLQQLFYASGIKEKENLVRLFNKTPELFKYMDVVKEVESSNIIVKPK